MVRLVRCARLALLALGLAACRGEPSLLCDRVRVVWPFFDLNPSLDTSDAEGLQIDLALRSSILPGTQVALTVQAEGQEPVAHPEAVFTDENGDMVFSDVSIPLGRVRFQIAAENECGDTTSARTPYVWDGQGYPACDLDLGVVPAAVAGLAPLQVLRAEHDADPGAPGAQLEVTVRAGRPDMTISLFALDVATGEQQALSEEAGDDLAASWSITLGEGEQSVRAVCVWEAGELRPASPTLNLFVDTAAPDCELVEPASRVRAADDLDPATEGVQFTVRGRSLADDVEGGPSSFTVQGEALAGSPLDADGEGSATATLLVDPDTAQEIAFRTIDRAGNPCEAAVTFP